MVSVPKFASKLLTWGEARVIKEQIKITPKISDRGVTCMYVGYNTNSGDDVYRIWNPDKNIIHITHDIIWLKMMFYKEKLTTGMVKGVT